MGATAGQAVDAADQPTVIAWWSLQFTPKVALTDLAVLMEVSASLRLFGGEDALKVAVAAQAADLGCPAVAWGPTATGTVALARCGVQDGFAAPLERLLDRLPLESLPAVAAHAGVLTRTGCRTLGDVRRLPRGGVSRRFTKSLLVAMDQAYGLLPIAFEWVKLPEKFSARLELPGRVEVAEGLMFGARRLLSQMAGWLAARHAGVNAFTMRFKYDFHRPTNVPPWGEITIRTADVTREMTHFSRLLGERLAQTELGASVEELVLVAGDVIPLEELSGSLLQEKNRDGETPVQLIERLSERLGADRVVRAAIRSDYRPEQVQTWRAATSSPDRGVPPLPAMPQPTWLMDKPLELAFRKGRPVYQGALGHVAGPYRVEAGWWDREDPRVVASGEACAARRDYFVMASEHGGLLWVFKDLAPAAGGRERWFLHGIFG
jgi:protein ImuB